MSQEKKFVADFLVRAREYGGHWEHIENLASLGTPDVSWACDEATGWIEVKVLKQTKYYFEKFQIPWMRQRILHQSHGLWILALDPHQNLVILRSMRSVANLPLSELSSERKWTVVRESQLPKPEFMYYDPGPKAWRNLLAILTGA